MQKEAAERLAREVLLEVLPENTLIMGHTQLERDVKKMADNVAIFYHQLVEGFQKCPTSPPPKQ
jgi:hypothetical protein